MQSRPHVLTIRRSCERLVASRTPRGTCRGVLLNCDAVLMDNNVPRVTTVAVVYQLYRSVNLQLRWLWLLLLLLRVIRSGLLIGSEVASVHLLRYVRRLLCFFVVTTSSCCTRRRYSPISMFTSEQFRSTILPI